MNTRIRTLLVLALSLVWSCDCENRLRQALSNEGDRKMKDVGGPSGPAEQEPNNDPTSATPIEIGKELRPVDGAIAAPDDVDWFALSVSGEPESFEVRVEPETGLDVSLHVEIEGGSPLAYDHGRRGDAERIPVLKVGSQAQRFAIRSESDSHGSYRIILKRHLAAKGLEAEPNDDASVATILNLPGELQGFYDRPDDRDTYHLSGEPAEAYVLEIGPTSVRQIARIYDDPALTSPQLTMQITIDSPGVIPNLGGGPATGLWLVLTPLGQPDPDTPYRLRVVAHPPTEGALEVEPNDDKPRPIEFGSPGEDSSRTVQLAGYLHAADDVDRFVVQPPDEVSAEEQVGGNDNPEGVGELQPGEPPALGDQQFGDQQLGEEIDLLRAYRGKEPPRIPVSATLRWSDPESALGFQWSSADGEVMEFRQTSPRTVVEACGLDLDAGKATVEIRAERLSGMPTIGAPQYELQIRETSAAVDWEAEPNDDRPKADVLETERRGALSTSDDLDMFVFAIPDDEAALEPVVQTVELTATAQGVDLVMRVLDDGGGLVANVDKGAVGGAEKLSVDLPPGVYFVELSWKSGELCAPYVLQLRESRR